MIWIVSFVVFIMLASAIAVLILPNMIAAVAASSVVSLALAILFALMRAPDVAMTEAAIGAGLSSLLLALRPLGLWRLDSEPLASKKSNFSITMGSRLIDDFLPYNIRQWWNCISAQNSVIEEFPERDL